MVPTVSSIGSTRFGVVKRRYEHRHYGAAEREQRQYRIRIRHDPEAAYGNGTGEYRGRDRVIERPPSPTRSPILDHAEELLDPVRRANDVFYLVVLDDTALGEEGEMSVREGAIDAVEVAVVHRVHRTSPLGGGDPSRQIADRDRPGRFAEVIQNELSTGTDEQGEEFIGGIVVGERHLDSRVPFVHRS